MKRLSLKCREIHTADSGKPHAEVGEFFLRSGRVGRLIDLQAPAWRGLVVEYHTAAAAIGTLHLDRLPAFQGLGEFQVTHIGNARFEIRLAGRDFIAFPSRKGIHGMGPHSHIHRRLAIDAPE